MSVLFKSGGESSLDLWWPASGVARLFLDTAKSAERFIEAESGLSEIVADEVTVDVVQLHQWLAALVDQVSRSNHDVVRGFLGPLIGVTAVLVARGERTSTDSLGLPTFLQPHAHAYEGLPS